MNTTFVNILRITFGLFCIAFGIDKFVEFLPTCSLTYHAPNYLMQGTGILEIGIGILLILDKYTMSTLQLITVVMFSGVLLHTLIGTYDFGGAFIGSIWGMALVYLYKDHQAFSKIKKIKPKQFLIGMTMIIALVMGRFVYMLPSVASGENAPTVQGTLLNGDKFDLKELRGKYVLVDFWGSWCGPCMREMPRIKTLHDKFQNAKFKDADGLVLLNVAIERDEKRWKRAIDRIGMNWKYHLIDLTTSFKFINSPIATEFGVKQVPSKFLLDKNGIIIGVNQSIEDLDNFLTENLN